MAKLHLDPPDQVSRSEPSSETAIGVSKCACAGRQARTTHCQTRWNRSWYTVWWGVFWDEDSLMCSYLTVSVYQSICLDCNDAINCKTTIRSFSKTVYILNLTLWSTETTIRSYPRTVYILNLTMWSAKTIKMNSKIYFNILKPL